MIRHILVVEDDVEIHKLLNIHFHPDEFHLYFCTTASSALKKIKSGDFDLIILDIKLPDDNGINVCRLIRNENRTIPIMMLTSLGDEMNKVSAFGTGADDYITKPFSILELIARTKALLRRTEMANDPSNEKTYLSFKQLHIDKNKRIVILNDRRLELTVKEFDILFLLASNAGKTFSRNEILKQVWGYSFESYEHTVTSHINRLRIKLETDLAYPNYILTSWGIGYRFTDEK